MHLDREIVVSRVLGGDARGGLAHAETDLGHHGRASAENVSEVERMRGIGDAEARQELRIGALLRRGKAPLAKDIAANRWMAHVSEDENFAAVFVAAMHEAFLQQSKFDTAGLDA